MKKWYFSKNGKISGPLDLEDARDFLTKDPDFYGWHPSFSQWRPVSCIVEFDDVVPEPVPPAQIPPELIQEFIDKKQELHDKIDLIDESIDERTTSMYELEQEIKIYKRITQNLSDEVKANITSIEQNHKQLQKNLSDLKKVTDIANNEIDEIVTDFDTRVADKTDKTDKTDKKPTTIKVKKRVVTEEVIQSAPEEKIENKMKLVTPPVQPDAPAIQENDKNESRGFGNKLKSVFSIEGADKSSKSNNDLDDALADLVASDTDDDIAESPEDEENKASRMRRRRRRR